jgi:hypothetical protein
MSTPEQINMSRPPGEKGNDAPLTDVMEEGIAFQLLQGLARVEHRLAAIEGAWPVAARCAGSRRSPTSAIS